MLIIICQIYYYFILNERQIVFFTFQIQFILTKFHCYRLLTKFRTLIVSILFFFEFQTRFIKIIFNLYVLSIDDLNICIFNAFFFQHSSFERFVIFSRNLHFSHLSDDELKLRRRFEK